MFEIVPVIHNDQIICIVFVTYVGANIATLLSVSCLLHMLEQISSPYLKIQLIMIIYYYYL